MKQEHYLEYHIIPIICGNEISAIMITVEDVTEQKLSDIKIKSLLKEKELLLREVHHRIKNNMASVESLLRLQYDSIDNKKCQSILIDASSRVSSMRVLYDRLFQSGDFIETSFEAYFSTLIDEILGVFPDGRDVVIKKEIDDFKVPLKNSFSLGIIINELFTNSMKYAFSREQQDKCISVLAEKRGDRIKIIVKDNGKGFNVDVSSKDETGFGMELISLLVQELGGESKYINDDGTTFVMEFDL